MAMSKDEQLETEAEIQKIETYIKHRTLTGQVQRLNDALEDFVNAVKDAFPKVL